MSTRPVGPAGTAPGAPAPGENSPHHGEPVRTLLHGGKPSGLRRPGRAMRSLGAVTLMLEAIVLLLAIQPIRMVEGGITRPQLGVLLGAAVAAILLTGLLRRPIGWWLASALQVALLVGGFLHWTLAAIGVIFGLVWIYVLHVRRTVLR